MARAARVRASRRSIVLRTIYALCLLGATGNHVAVIAEHGLFWDYGGVPRASALFWTMLTVLDPAAVVLLFARPRAGVAATAAIIVVDVVHNVWISAPYLQPFPDALWSASQLLQQIGFMIFVVATAPFAWTGRPGAA